MGWIAGYHDHFESRSYETHETWEDARAAVVHELDQRITALCAEPGTDDSDELAELRAAMAYFVGEVLPDEEAASDGACLTFVLGPDQADEPAAQVDAFAAEVIR